MALLLFTPRPRLGRSRIGPAGIADRQENAMTKKDGMQQTTGEDKAPRPELPADQRDVAPATNWEVMVEPEERTPEEAGYGYGV
jgi:hypothetical protein